jgi:AcrR family transcriptional regulator
VENSVEIRDLVKATIKSERTRLIMDAGHQLFLERGIVAVEMKDISAAARISRATLYRYFSSKQELAFAILKHEATTQLIPKYRSEREMLVGNGYEKFSQFVEQLVNAYEQFPDFFRYSAMVEYHYGQQLHAKEQANWYRELYAGLFLEDTPVLFLQEGQRDGSVRRDIDPHVYLATVLATLPTLAEHIAINPEAARLTYNVGTPDILLRTAAQALIDALKPTDG